MFHSVCSYFHWKRKKKKKKLYAWTTFQWICFLCLKHSCAWECYLLLKDLHTTSGGCAGAHWHTRHKHNNNLSQHTSVMPHTHTYINIYINRYYKYKYIYIYINYLKINCQNVKCAKYFPYSFHSTRACASLCCAENFNRYTIYCYELTDASCKCIIYRVISTKNVSMIMYVSNRTLNP